MRYDIIAFTLISLISIASIAGNVFLFIKNRRMLKTIVELHISVNALQDMISVQATESNTDQGDGFIKFLSDSREWAFGYIDDVQQTLFVLKEKYDNKKALDEPLQKLFDMLPENNKEK